VWNILCKASASYIQYCALKSTQTTNFVVWYFRIDGIIGSTVFALDSATTRNAREQRQLTRLRARANRPRPVHDWRCCCCWTMMTGTKMRMQRGAGLLRLQRVTDAVDACLVSRVNVSCPTGAIGLLLNGALRRSQCTAWNGLRRLAPTTTAPRIYPNGQNSP